MTKCAKCSGPGKQTLYRAEIPPGANAAVCYRHGALWAIPCCRRHQRLLSRCRIPGCSLTGNRGGGLCNAHRQRRVKEKGKPWRNCPRCLHCKNRLGLHNYVAAGLCRTCYHALEDTTDYEAELRVLNGGTGANVEALCRQLTVPDAAKRLGVEADRVRAWVANDTPVPEPVEQQVRQLLKGA